MTEYTWDYRNRLTNVTVKDSSEDVIQESDYTYDPFDKRIGVEVDPDGDGAQTSTERWTAYDGVNPYADFDGSGNLTHRYLYGPRTDQVLARMDSSQDVAWYLTDHLGSVRDLADPGGNVIDHITYDSFGNVLSESVPAEGDRFKYTGRELDSETGLYYYRARYYDPATGRFISQDPIGFEGGDANIYRYVGNGPTLATDPMGLQEGSPRPGLQRLPPVQAVEPPARAQPLPRVDPNQPPVPPSNDPYPSTRPPFVYPIPGIIVPPFIFPIPPNLRRIPDPGGRDPMDPRDDQWRNLTTLPPQEGDGGSYNNSAISNFLRRGFEGWIRQHWPEIREGIDDASGGAASDAQEIIDRYSPSP